MWKKSELSELPSGLTTLEFVAINTKLPTMAMLASKVFTRAVGFDLMITGLRV